MPVAQRPKQQQRATDDERRVSDGPGHPLEVAAGARGQCLQTRQSAQVAFRKAPQHSPRVAGRINDEALHVACKLG